MTSRTRHRLAFVFASALLISCDNASQVVGPPQTAVTGYSVVIVSGDAQFGAPNTALATALTFKVVDATNKVVARATGTAVVSAGGGTVSAATWKTGSTGQATVNWTLGATGVQSLTVTQDGGGSAAFSAKLLTIAADSGNNQVAAGGTMLAQKLVIQVTNTATATPAVGATGKWIVSAGTGTVSSATFTTDANGRANVSFTTGATGPQQVSAVLNSGGSVVFNATIAGISIFDGNNQVTGPSSLLPIPAAIIVRDPANNPLAGMTGTWVASGGGTVSSGTFTTDVNGKASVNWTVGATGAQSLTAALTGGASVVFNASIATLSIYSGNNQTANGGSMLPAQPTIIVRDGANNPVVGATGTWSVASGGGLISSPTFTTDATGKAAVSWTLGGSGTQTLTASLNGGSSVNFNATPISAGSHLVILGGNNQRGRPGVNLGSVIVQLVDVSNNPISGGVIQWSAPAGGAIGAASQTTDGSGYGVNTWALSWAQYQQSLKARVAGIDSVTFTATVDTANMRFTIVSGSGQTGPAGSSLAQPLIIQLKDTLGNAISGAPGSFSVVGGGSISKTGLSTSAAGRDSVTWILGSTGTQQVVANIAAIGSRTFSATIGTVPPPAGSKLTIVLGNNQKGTPKDTLAVFPTVEFRDPSNNLVSGASVDWSVEAGTNLGAVRFATRATGADGRAANAWLLGWAKATQTLKAKVAGYDSVTFTATLDTAKLRWRIVSGNGQSAVASTTLPNKLVVELKDTLGVAYAGVPGTFAVSGGGTITKTSLLTGATGSDSVAWTLGASGTQTVTATNTVFGTLTFSATITDPPPPPPAGTSLCATSAHSYELDMTLGQMRRFLANDPAAPFCLNFDNVRDKGRQYLVLFEDQPPFGDYTHGFFKGTNDANVFGFTISTSPPPVVTPVSFVDYAGIDSPDAQAQSAQQGPENSWIGWDGPSGPLYELQPLVVNNPSPSMVNGDVVAANSMSSVVTYNVGDTLTVYMYGIARLSIADGYQKVVVKKVTNNLVFTEDVRLATTLVRENGTAHNTPLTDAQMTQIAADYDAYGFIQNNLLFNNTYNQATTDAGKIVVVHTLMSSNSTWGYTLANTNVILFDYWVGTLDGVTPGLNQNSHRVADNLITHEVAHTRHYAFNSASISTPANGIPWIEGFARFTERAAIAHRLLLVQNFSRTGDVTLPKDAALNGSFFVSDVADFTRTASSVFLGYDAFAYFFDYFSDQYALAGGDWRAGIRTLLTNSATESGINTALNSMLPGNTFYSLLTKARIALYADNFTVGLPNVTQYTQYNLRLSRASLASDPRTTFPKVVPGNTYTKSASLGAGASSGFLIDGVNSTSNAAINITNSGTYARGVVSITRIK